MFRGFSTSDYNLNWEEVESYNDQNFNAEELARYLEICAISTDDAIDFSNSYLALENYFWQITGSDYFTDSGVCEEDILQKVISTIPLKKNSKLKYFNLYLPKNKATPGKSDPCLKIKTKDLVAAFNTLSSSKDITQETTWKEAEAKVYTALTTGDTSLTKKWDELTQEEQSALAPYFIAVGKYDGDISAGDIVSAGEIYDAAIEFKTKSGKHLNVAICESDITLLKTTIMDFVAKNFRLVDDGEDDGTDSAKKANVENNNGQLVCKDTGGSTCADNMQKLISNVCPKNEADCKSELNGYILQVIWSGGTNIQPDCQQGDDNAGAEKCANQLAENSETTMADLLQYQTKEMSLCYPDLVDQSALSEFGCQ